MRSSIQGLAQLQKRLTTQDFAAAPAGAFLRDWQEDVKSEALDRAPNWRGGIVRAIQANQDTKKFPLWARVFSDAPEARWSEYGTGILSEDPRSNRRPYMPPPERVAAWANYYGLDPYAVALGILERGGTPPTHFFSDAERAADKTMVARLSRFGRDIEYQAEKG